MKQLFQRLFNRETILYIIFGVMTTVVNYIVFWAVFSLAGPKSALFSNAVAFIFAVIFAYVTNKIFVFESKSWAKSVLKTEIPAFIAARLLSFGFEELGLLAYGLIADENLTVFGINGTLVVKAFLSVIVIIINYVISKFYIFKNGQDT